MGKLLDLNENFYIIKEKIYNIPKKSSIYIFLDYDGTLSPITNDPNVAFLPKHTKSVLVNLLNSKRVKMAIISGRSVHDIEKFISLTDLVIAGNHGYHIKQNNREILKIGEECIQTLKLFERNLKQILLERVVENMDYKNIKIESKILSITVHFRNVKKQQTRDNILPIINSVINKIDNSEKLCVLSGKFVKEIIPKKKWDKGKAMRFLLENEFGVCSNGEEKPFVFYIGDDLTDENAFDEIKNNENVNGFGILVIDSCVLGRMSAASYSLNGTEEVTKFLRRLSEIIG